MRADQINPEQKIGYSVEIDRRRDHYEREDVQWGSWSESYSNRFQKVSKTDKYPDVLSLHDFKAGDDCFVVWAEYSTGDSFGHSSRGSVEPIGVFKDYATAQELVDALNKWNTSPSTAKTWDDKYAFDFTTSDGQKFAYGFVPWAGYFERLDDIHIEKTWVR